MIGSTGELSAAALQRQREEIRHGLVRVTTAGAIIVLVVVALATASILEAYRSRRAAQRAEAATRQGREALYEACLAQARAVRVSGESGRRSRALSALKEAARI